MLKKMTHKTEQKDHDPVIFFFLQCLNEVP